MSEADRALVAFPSGKLCACGARSDGNFPDREIRALLVELFEDPDVQMILGGNPNRIQALMTRAFSLISRIKEADQ